MRLVLDTNVALDLWVFNDTRVEALRRSIEQRESVVLVNTLVIDEWERVLKYPPFALDSTAQAMFSKMYRSLATEFVMPLGFSRESLGLPTPFPRCRDRDDEHFLALAFHSGADALVSKDKALLKLRSSARRFGVRISTIQEIQELKAS